MLKSIGGFFWGSRNSRKLLNKKKKNGNTILYLRIFALQTVFTGQITFLHRGIPVLPSHFNAFSKPLGCHYLKNRGNLYQHSQWVGGGI